MLHKHGVVKATVSEEGTTLRWAVFSRNWASLYYAMEWLTTVPGPYRLEYFLAGWFTEIIEDPMEARDRVHMLLSKSDVHLLSRTFVKQADPNRHPVPDLLQDVLSKHRAQPERSVECAYDNATSQFKVCRIGEESTIAKFWGLEPVSYPCINGGTYDQIVSEVYPKVIKTGEPYYGHVYAAMRFPNQPLHWFPYHRVVLPHTFSDGRKGVTVVSEFSPVDIQVV